MFVEIISIIHIGTKSFLVVYSSGYYCYNLSLVPKTIKLKKSSHITETKDILYNFKYNIIHLSIKFTCFKYNVFQ